MAVERERGISVSSAVMSFEQEGLAFDLLDMPGHQEFSEDTYRTPDRGRQRGDGARRRPQWRQGGIEEQTSRLFEVCRARRADHHLCQQARPLGPRPVRSHRRDGAISGARRDPGPDRSAAGATFSATYDLFADGLLLFERGVHDRVTEPVHCNGLDDAKLPRLLPKPHSPNCARRSRWRRGCVRPSTHKPIARAI